LRLAEGIAASSLLAEVLVRLADLEGAEGLEEAGAVLRALKEKENTGGDKCVYIYMSG